MRRYALPIIVLILIVATPTSAHDIWEHPTIVIDTDMGLDDVVTLAMALQNPQVNLTAVVACEGVCSGDKCTEHLERMLEEFNRRDVRLYAPAEAGGDKAPPAFRDFAETAVGQALATSTERFRRGFTPEAYLGARGKTIVLVLGPLTNLAAALQARPEIRTGIAKVIVSGAPDAAKSWNAAFDADALAVVKAAGVRLEFVVTNQMGRKPGTWRQGELTLGQGTSVGEDFVRRLLAAPATRGHYTGQLGSFHDELVFLYYVDHSLFMGPSKRKEFLPEDGEGIVKLLCRLLSDGRQQKPRVVFGDPPLPDGIFRKDVGERKPRIIAKNGPAEWFAQILMNELHEHLGVYSVIGVKMGLRAAELLNAPQHGMKVVSHVPARPPFSCLNDGIIVATGCTPGRVLFTHRPGSPESIEVSFQYNGRRIRLAIKEEYRERITAEFAALLKEHTLEDREYWDGVRRFGLEVWENWHRRALFEVTPAAAADQ